MKCVSQEDTRQGIAIEKKDDNEKYNKKHNNHKINIYGENVKII